MFSYSLSYSAIADHDVTGPRYCPSLEAKITRFGHKDSHTIWLEPEGYDSGVLNIYLKSSCTPYSAT